MKKQNPSLEKMGMTKSMLIRSMFCVLLVLLIAFGIIIARLSTIMLINSEWYHSKALDQQLRDTKIDPQRGTIYDRNMKPLAQSATVYTVFISPSNIQENEREVIADGLSKILEVDKEKILAAAGKKTYYEIIKRQVENNIADEVRKFIVENKLGSAVGLDIGTKRYYPNNDFASTVLGFVGYDNNGLSGIESYYDEYLKGTPGRVIALKNARGADMPFTYEKMEDAKNGNNLILTIDEGVQFFVEKHLEIAAKENKVTNRAACVVMDVKTGEILAMATKPDFNPNEPFKIYDQQKQAEIDKLEGDKRTEAIKNEQQQQWRNKIVSDTYVPGSVFKIFTGSAAYEKNVITENSTFHCPGYIVIGGRKMRCHKAGGHGTVNLIEAYVGSCNPAFISIGQKLGAKEFYKYFEAFGFTEKTGIDLPGEAQSLFFKENELTAVRLASESFGQTVSITPIQMISGVAAVANGGYLVKPHVVKQITDQGGNIVKNFDTETKRQVISSKTASAIGSMLEEVVKRGSGRNATVKGYRIAGKTGTSEKLNEYLQTGVKENIASFCAYAPVEDPKIAILILLDEPHGTSTFGGVIASPVVGQMFADILPYLGIEPHYTEEELRELDVSAPSVTGKTVSGAEGIIKQLELNVQKIGNGDTVIRQVPEAGISVPRGGTVVIYTEENLENKVVVPNLSDMSVSGANKQATDSGLNIKLVGTALEQGGAKVYRQSIEAGAKVDRGTVITVYFRHDDNVE